MGLKQTFKSKRGIAIENAILFMVIIFMFCALLISLTSIGYYQLKIDKMMLLRNVEIEQIGEDYLTSIKAGNTSFTKEYENYAYEVNGNALTVWHKANEAKTAVLYVEAELTAEKEINVITWRYSLPTQTE